jgi:hypothetical protein
MSPGTEASKKVIYITSEKSSKKYYHPTKRRKTDG